MPYRFTWIRYRAHEVREGLPHHKCHAKEVSAKMADGTKIGFCPTCNNIVYS